MCEARIIRAITTMRKKLSKYVINEFGEGVLRKAFLKDRTRSFTGGKTVKFNRIIKMSVPYGNDSLKLSVHVDKNGQIYDIYSQGKRMISLFYDLYGHPFNYEKIKAMFD